MNTTIRKLNLDLKNIHASMNANASNCYEKYKLMFEEFLGNIF